jgi:SAM-dependent methyltransferase
MNKDEMASVTDREPARAPESSQMPKAFEAFNDVLLHDLSPADVEYLAPHKKRIHASIEWVAPYMREDVRLLELGSNLLSKIFNRLYPDLRADCTVTDLRYSLPIPSEQYDVIANTELLEHLKDQVEAPIDHFDFSGFNSLLSESYRLLKPGGVMFVTTPNAASIGIIYRVLMGWPPHYHQPHVREYTVHELKRSLEEHHFSVERIETLNVYDDLPEHTVESMRKIVSGNGYSADDRGDCSFVIARK